MNKTLLVIRREYITRVRNKTFLLSTFLLPIMLLLLIFGSAFFASKGSEKKLRIAVVNDPGFVRSNLVADSSKVIFDFNPVIDEKNFSEKDYDGILLLNPDSSNKKFRLVSKKTIGSFTKGYMEERLDKAFEHRQLQNHGIDIAQLDSINSRNSGSSSIDNSLIDDKGGKKNVNATVNAMVGFGSGILIYITMFIFGAMVMRGVMEEKTSRIAEVMVSSVKPFQLMMGKIIGIGAVGLTQLFLWVILMAGLFAVAQLFLPSDLMHQVQQMQSNQLSGIPGGQDMVISGAAKSMYSFMAAPWLKIISCFIFYFLGGYLFYSALFAAVGSVINEDPQEAQSLMLPISMPLVFGFIILSSNITSPDSPAMVWASMIPFTSPIAMMGRIASNPPLWQVAVSMLLLIGGFLFTTWIAAKIYRTGILLYGKKVTWKEMFRWAFRRS